MAREAYDTGISLCRPLYYEYPETEEAYIYENEYFFGSDILVAPITTAAGADGMTQKERVALFHADPELFRKFTTGGR